MLLQTKLKTQINDIRGFDIQSPLCNELKSWYRLIVCHLMRYVIKHKIHYWRGAADSNRFFSLLTLMVYL